MEGQQLEYVQWHQQGSVQKAELFFGLPLQKGRNKQVQKGFASCRTDKLTLLCKLDQKKIYVSLCNLLEWGKKRTKKGHGTKCKGRE